MQGNQNSRIETHLGVIRNLLDDIATLIESSDTLRVATYSINPRREIERDYRYIASRTQHESLPFLTITLPSLGKWYDRILSGNNEACIVGFQPYTAIPCNGGASFACPLFCRMLAYVIHDEGGSDQDKARIIRAYRSLFYLFYKLEVPFSEEQLSAALLKWKRNEQELEEFEFPCYYDSDPIALRDIISGVIGHDETLFTRIDPRHGPGAVAGGEDNMGKWETATYIPSLHRVYPRYDLYFGWRSEGRISISMCEQILTFVRKSGTATEAVSRLLFVPKDSRGPRTISCEPKELMFVQQGVARNLMRVFHCKTHGRINFVDQTVNANLALTSSKSQEYATVDLEDASDRVTTKLVDLVFPEWCLRYLHALRSTSTQLPDGSLFKNHFKYAPMGSALCFPIESLLFWALAVLAGENAGLSRSEAMAGTYVYGDDIIIRPQVFSSLVETFEKFALKVNFKKSYVSGPFRESCGTDAFNGICVTPFKIKKDISHRSPDGNLATAMCEYSSTCFALNYRKTGNFLLDLANRKYPGILVHNRKLGGLCVVDPCGDLDLSKYQHGWNTRLCRVWVRAWVLDVPVEPCRLDGLSRLLRAYYCDWEEHDPDRVVVLRATKIRKRNILVELIP